MSSESEEAMLKATQEGPAQIAKQQADAAAAAEAEKARQAAAQASATYPREYNAHSWWVDGASGHGFTGTQYGYDTEAEGLAGIDAARQAGKYVMCMDTGSGAFIVNEAGDWRITTED